MEYRHQGTTIQCNDCNQRLAWVFSPFTSVSILFSIILKGQGFGGVCLPAVSLLSLTCLWSGKTQAGLFASWDKGV